jgi:hypothetical protein
MSEEQNAGAPAETAATPAKKKKVNRLTAKEIESKLQDMMSKNLTNAVYYKHLIQRKNQVTSKS